MLPASSVEAFTYASWSRHPSTARLDRANLLASRYALVRYPGALSSTVRAGGSYPLGCRFESCRAYHFS